MVSCVWAKSGVLIVRGCEAARTARRRRAHRTGRRSPGLCRSPRTTARSLHKGHQSARSHRPARRHQPGDDRESLAAISSMARRGARPVGRRRRRVVGGWKVTASVENLVKMPPSPTVTIGPNCGSLVMPSSISVPVGTCACTLNHRTARSGDARVSVGNRGAIPQAEDNPAGVGRPGRDVRRRGLRYQGGLDALSGIHRRGEVTSERAGRGRNAKGSAGAVDSFTGNAITRAARFEQSRVPLIQRLVALSGAGGSRGREVTTTLPVDQVAHRAERRGCSHQTGAPKLLSSHVPSSQLEGAAGYCRTPAQLGGAAKGGQLMRPKRRGHGRGLHGSIAKCDHGNQRDHRRAQAGTPPGACARRRRYGC